jgi:hypothetical protein
MLHSTESKLASGSVSAVARSTAKETFGKSPRRFRACSSIAGVSSAAVTWPDAPTARTASSAALPVPVAMSSTICPGEIRAMRMSVGTNCRIGRPKVRSNPLTPLP